MHSISKKKSTSSPKLQSNNNTIKINNTNPKNTIKSVKTKSLSIKSISKLYSTTKSISTQQKSICSSSTTLPTLLHSQILKRSFSSIQTTSINNKKTTSTSPQHVSSDQCSIHNVSDYDKNYFNIITKFQQHNTYQFQFDSDADNDNDAYDGYYDDYSAQEDSGFDYARLDGWKGKDYISEIQDLNCAISDLRHRLTQRTLFLKQLQHNMNEQHYQIVLSNQLLQNNLKLLHDDGKTSIQPIIHFPLINWSYNGDTIQIHNHNQHIFDIFHQSIIPQLIIGQQGQNESQNYISNRELNEIAYLYTKAPLNNTNNNNNSDNDNSSNNNNSDINNNMINNINTNPWIKITNKDEQQYNIAAMNGYEFKWTNYIDFDFTDNLKSSSSSISNHNNNSNNNINNKKKLQIKRKEVNLNQPIYNVLSGIDELSEQLLIIRNSDVYNFSIPTPIDSTVISSMVDCEEDDDDVNDDNDDDKPVAIDIFNQNVNQGLLPFLSTESNNDNTSHQSKFDGTIEKSLATIKLKWELKTTLTKQQKQRIKVLSKVFSRNYKSHPNQYITNTTIKIETPSAVNQKKKNSKQINPIEFKLDLIDKSTSLQHVIDQISSSSSSSITQLSYKTFLISSQSVLCCRNIEIIGNNGIIQDLKHIRIGELLSGNNETITFQYSNASIKQ